MAGKANTGDVRIGTSGWSYRHWRGAFYPDHIPQKQWFAHYASIFNTVELNSTFYRLPPRSTFAKWRQQAPEGFVYAVKANRLITHLQKLVDVEEALGRFLEAVRELGEHLGPILYQLPPSLHQDLERLSGFAALLPPGLTHVFEFRHQSWFNEATFEVLTRAGASFCAHDMGGLQVPRTALGTAAYVRFHGSSGRYSGTYSEAAIAQWAAWLHTQAERGRSIYAYFNNDVGAHAPGDARRLRAALQKLAM